MGKSILLLAAAVGLTMTAVTAAQATVGGIDYSTSSTTPVINSDYSGAASGIAGIMGLITILIIIYGIICFLVPIFIYRIMRRGTEMANTMSRIEFLLRKGEHGAVVADWDRKAFYE
jgi:uncharacterized oligopeptide transporter (OPT) family protein